MHNLKVKIIVKELWTDTKTLNPENIAKMCRVDPEDKIPIRVACASKQDSVAVVYISENEYPTLAMGRTYELTLQFVGEDFIDRRKRKLKLDLSSYDTFNLALP